MTRADDSSLQDHELANVIKHADRLLKEAGAIGVFPTPIDVIMAAAKVTVIEDEILDESMLRRCSIPDDHIDPRRSAFFMARSVLRDILSGVRTC